MTQKRRCTFQRCLVARALRAQIVEREALCEGRRRGVLAWSQGLVHEALPDRGEPTRGVLLAVALPQQVLAGNLRLQSLGTLEWLAPDVLGAPWWRVL